MIQLLPNQKEVIYLALKYQTERPLDTFSKDDWIKLTTLMQAIYNASEVILI